MIKLYEGDGIYFVDKETDEIVSNPIPENVLASGEYDEFFNYKLDYERCNLFSDDLDTYYLALYGRDEYDELFINYIFVVDNYNLADELRRIMGYR